MCLKFSEKGATLTLPGSGGGDKDPKRNQQNDATTSPNAWKYIRVEL